MAADTGDLRATRATWGGGFRGIECTLQRVGKNRRCQQNSKRDVCWDVGWQRRFLPTRCEAHSVLPVPHLWIPFALGAVVFARSDRRVSGFIAALLLTMTSYLAISGCVGVRVGNGGERALDVVERGVDAVDVAVAVRPRPPPHERRSSQTARQTHAALHVRRRTSGHVAQRYCIKFFSVSFKGYIDTTPT